MTPEEFIIWLKGFADAANEYNITPKQWSIVKERLDSVSLYDLEDTDVGFINAEDWYVSFTSGSWQINYSNNT